AAHGAVPDRAAHAIPPLRPRTPAAGVAATSRAVDDLAPERHRRPTGSTTAAGRHEPASTGAEPLATAVHEDAARSRSTMAVRGSDARLRPRALPAALDRGARRPVGRILRRLYEHPRQPRRVRRRLGD